jgi:hypothetical protein
MTELLPLPRQRADLVVTVEGQVVASHITDQIGILGTVAEELTGLHHKLKRLEAQNPELRNLYARLRALAEDCSQFGVVRYSRSNPGQGYSRAQGYQPDPYGGFGQPFRNGIIASE